MINPLSWVFWLVYLYCGVSDILDGYVARKWQQQSDLGSQLDSVADVLFFVVIAVLCIFNISFSKYIWFWIGFIICIRIVTYSIGYIKYHVFCAIHTNANKVMGLLLFCIPIWIVLFGDDVISSILLIVAIYSSLEELLIVIKNPYLDREKKSMYSWRKHVKEFRRENVLLSLCGLNCGLCPMYIGKYCPGCGGGEGNQACSIARCSKMHNDIEYCFVCKEYPCHIYQGIDEFDSFITHQNQISNLHLAKKIGIEQYNCIQLEKVEILKYVLENYNDGRKKTLYSIAVNLLELPILKEILCKIQENKDLDMLSIKDKAQYVSMLFQEAAKQEGIELKLRKKIKVKAKT